MSFIRDYVCSLGVKLGIVTSVCLQMHLLAVTHFDFLKYFVTLTFVLCFRNTFLWLI